MTRFKFEEPARETYSIKVVAVGGGGCNALNTMVKEGIEGVDFIATNTDIQALSNSATPNKIQLGVKLTNGLGSGGNPEIGRKAIEENRDDVKEVLAGSDVIFVTCGMGGGTGTGASPMIAQIAKELNALTVGIVTKPFDFEGTRRARQAIEGIHELKKYADAVVIIPNQKLLSIVDRETPFVKAFKVADYVLLHATKGMAEVITHPGLVNVDFADVRTLMTEPGDAFIGIGQAKGDERALKAAEQATRSPLLEEECIKGAQGILVNITGSEDLTLYEVNDAISLIRGKASDDVNIIFGACFNDNGAAGVNITVIATGIRVNQDKSQKYTTDEQKLEVPTFKRKESLSVTEIDSQNQTDLDTPTFLRRKNGV